jgi:brefeldin A-inhibited guanine nucleotide-exchange protein
MIYLVFFYMKNRSAFYPATDVIVLKFMVEVCWAPMLAAFSVPLDRTDDEIVISQCLEGFRCAVHVTAAMLMKTQRDAFITSLAKFTSLHSAVDIKHKNIEAIKVCSFLLRCKF